MGQGGQGGQHQAAVTPAQRSIIFRLANPGSTMTALGQVLKNSQ